MSRIFKSALEMKMESIRFNRRGVDPRTGAPYPEQTEAEKLEAHGKLGVCRQQEGGPCHLPVTKPPGDKRCRMSKSMQVSCPYLGPVGPLKAVIEEEDEERAKDEMINEAPPETNL